MKFILSLKHAITLSTVALVTLTTQAQTVEVLKAEPVNKHEFVKNIALNLAESLQQQTVKPASLKIDMPFTSNTVKVPSNYKITTKLSMVAE